jgi:tRNA dimethylallyltransferase
VKNLSKILCIVGPTASGKSGLALHLSQVFNGEIVNADSRQFYRELNAGTAKPKDQQGIPHHLIDCTSVLEPWSVGDFVKEAHAAMAAILSRGKLPILVGGTGLYLRSLLEGLAPVPEIETSVREALALDLRIQGLTVLYAELCQGDPSLALRLQVTDTQRILRALEVLRQTGKSLSSFWQETTAGPAYDVLKIGLGPDREELYAVIDARVWEMMGDGLAQEARGLWRDFSDNPVLPKTIGYAEWQKLGFDDQDAVVALIQQNTRRLAKRQMTWFRRDKEVVWFVPKKNGTTFSLATQDEMALKRRIGTFLGDS